MACPTLSIVIPALNEQAAIERAIRSALALGSVDVPVEVIVVDGGSNDQTIEIATAAGATVVVSEQGRGIQLARGAEEAKGQIVLFLHADCWLASKAGEQLRLAIEDNGVLWGAFYQSIEARGLRYRLLEAGNWLRARWGLPYGDQGIFVRTETLAVVGGVAPLPLMEDVELSDRLRKVVKPKLLPGPLHISARRWKKRGVVRQTLLNWRLLAAWRRGASAQDLAKRYQVHNENCTATASSVSSPQVASGALSE